MKSFLYVIVGSLLIVLVGACSGGGSIGSVGDASMDSLQDSVIYIAGTNMANFYKQFGIKDPNFALLNKGIQDAINGESQIDGQMANALFQRFQRMQMEVIGKENMAKGKAFLEENSKKEGVQTTASGLQYLVNEMGSGPNPKTTDRVKVHYEGRLIDGTVFDSSISRGTPVDFGVTQVIRGWTEALQLMSVGSKWQLYIPAELAYGPTGSQGAIGPNETLIFDIELLEINPQPSLPPGHSQGDGHNH